VGWERSTLLGPRAKAINRKARFVIIRVGWGWDVKAFFFLSYAGDLLSPWIEFTQGTENKAFGKVARRDNAKSVGVMIRTVGA
jgi:hypothetical protein